MLRPTLATLAATVLLPLACGASAQDAEPAAVHLPKTVRLIDTPRPGGFFGYWGVDLFLQQQAAQRFSVPPGADLRLAQVALWLMNNSDSEQHDVTVSVQTDALDEGGQASQPSGHRLESWSRPVGTLGWNPVQQRFSSLRLPALRAGHDYWVVAQSKSQPIVDPVWTFSKNGTAMNCETDSTGAWQVCGESAALTLRVDAWPGTGR